MKKKRENFMDCNRPQKSETLKLHPKPPAIQYSYITVTLDHEL